MNYLCELLSQGNFTTLQCRMTHKHDGGITTSCGWRRTIRTQATPAATFGSLWQEYEVHLHRRHSE